MQSLKALLRKDLALTRTRWSKALDVLRSRPKIDEALYEELEAQLIAGRRGRGGDAPRSSRRCKRAQRDKRLEDGAALEAELKARAGRAAHAPRATVPRAFQQALRDPARGRERRRQDHDHRQAHAPLPVAGASRCCSPPATPSAPPRVEQLAEWGRRHHVTVVAQDKGDSAAVIFDAMQSARAKDIDVVLADTAGRLPTQLHLMDEIRKVKRVMAKADPSAPHETLLVIDANTGQNAVRQVKAFDDALGLTGLVVTKLDGTAKGGAVAAIAREHPVPIRFIGIGEKAGRPAALRRRRVRRGAVRVIQFSAVAKRYPGGLEALRGVSLEMAAGEMVAVTGHSGAGKSTLLKLAAGIERATSGTVVVNGQNLGALGETALAVLRRRVGFVFQDHKLLYDRSAHDNVALPLRVAGFGARRGRAGACARHSTRWACSRASARCPWRSRAASSSGCASRAPS